MRIHYRDLFNYGTRITKDEEFVKDCIQDLFLTLWEKRMTISETSFVKYYLLKALRRRIHKVADNKRNFGLYHGDLSPLYIDTENAENQVIRKENLKELIQKMRKILANLSHRQQEVIYFRFYMDADIDEIAEIMELNRQSVYNLLHNSLSRLKKLNEVSSFSLSRLYLLLPSVL